MCISLQTVNSFDCSFDVLAVTDSLPHLLGMWKTSLVFASLAVQVQAGSSTASFYTPTKQYKNIARSEQSSHTPGGSHQRKDKTVKDFIILNQVVSEKTLMKNV